MACAGSAAGRGYLDGAADKPESAECLSTEHAPQRTRIHRDRASDE